MKPSVKYGLITAVTGIVISMIIFLIGLDKSQTGENLGYINIVILIAAMVMAVKERRENELGGFIEFGQAFSTGMMVVLIASAITAVYTFLYISVINPGFRDYVLQKQITKMETSGQSQEQIDMALPYVEKFMTPVMMTLFTFLGGLVVGVIIALIIAAIMKKSNPNPFSNTEPASAGSVTS
ncbi:MAG: DUF4199 domain-containing protein [Bacteroidia bacterium]